MMASASIASAQYTLNPPVAAPYGRAAIANYLPGGRLGDPLADYNYGTVRQITSRNPMLRPDVFGQFFQPLYELPDAGLAQVDLIDRFIAERNPKVSATGYPTGFLIANPYFSGPSPGAYIPFDPRAPFNPYPGRAGR
jgi:hypothetical protein